MGEIRRKKCEQGRDRTDHLVPALPSLGRLRFRELGITLLNRQPLEFHRLRLRLGVARRLREMRLQVRLARLLSDPPSPHYPLSADKNGASKSRRRGMDSILNGEKEASKT